MPTLGGKEDKNMCFHQKISLILCFPDVFQQIMSGIIALMERGGKMSDCFTIDCRWFVRFVSHMMTITT